MVEIEIEIEIHPRQAKMDALLAAIKDGADEKVITTKCKALNLADFPLILIQLCLKPETAGEKEKQPVDKEDESVVESTVVTAPVAAAAATTTTTTTATTTQSLEQVGAAATDTATVNATVTEAAEAAKKVEKRLQALVALRATRICRNMMDTGVCDQNKNDKSCQYSHPKKCNHYATYGLAKTNPNGCRSADCKYLHVVICRYKTKDQCKKQVCFLQHLQPRPEKKTAKVKPEVKPEVRKVDHQKTRPISVEPKQGPTAAVTTERSFLDQGQSQRLSRLENMLEKVMMMLIPRQPRSFAQAASGWPAGTLEEGFRLN
jgi:hypothetical protein